MISPHAATGLLLATALSLMPLAPAAGQSKDLVLTANPDAIVHFRAGWSATEMLNSEGAAKHLKLAVDKDPGFGLARAMYAAQLGGSPESQKAELDRAVADAAKGSTGELLLTMAVRERALNRPAAAAALWKAASALVPSDPFIAFTALQAATGTTPAARLPGGKANSTRFPDHAPAYNTIAYGSWAANDHAGALAAAMKQVSLLAKDPNPHDTYAELLQWDGKLSDAAVHYQEAVTIEPSFTEGYIGLAEVAALQGQYDRARGYVNQAISHSTLPAQKLAYMRDIAGIYALQGDRKSNEGQLSAVVTEAKAQGNTRLAAIVYAQLAASAGARGDAKASHAYLDLANSTFSGKAAPIGFFAAMAHGQLKHWAPAAAAIEAAKAAPDAAAFAGRIAAAQAFLVTAQGKPADAIALLSSADLTDPVVEGRLAEAYAASGRPADASKLQQQIMSDYALTLVDWAAANARYRARIATKGMSKK